METCQEAGMRIAKISKISGLLSQAENTEDILISSDSRHNLGS